MEAAAAGDPDLACEIVNSRGCHEPDIWYPALAMALVLLVARENSPATGAKGWTA